MRSRICPRVAFTGLIVAMSLSAAVMVRAQAPAGPNRPAQVPEEYVVTPFGYFHPSCVVHLANGEELLEGGQLIQRADGTTYTVPVCKYPHYTARGEMFSASNIKPLTIVHSWIVSWSTTDSTSYGKISADWNVPLAPLSYDDQVIYFFPGLVDYQEDATIIQPVLGWNADFRRAWGIASWNCCPSGTAHESSPVRVNTGDLIVGTVESTCSPGTLSCPAWNITTQDQSTGGSTTLSDTPSEGQTFDWAFAGALEVYSIVRCSDYPPNQYLTFYPTLYDDNFNIIQNPSWSLSDYASGLTPQCDYGGQLSSGEVTLDFGSFTLTVSPTGDGVVVSTDDLINCPGTCTETYQPGTQVTLNAYPAWGWGFAGWSGGGCSGTGSCNVVMSQNQTVSATFLPLYTLTVTTNGNGSVTSTDGYINCPGVCSYNYLSNTQVTLNANPAQGWSLSAWGGACSGNGSCDVPMTQNQSVSATFTQNYYTLTVSNSGDGRITSTDGYINCPGIDGEVIPALAIYRGTCSHTYLSLTQVTLDASPVHNWSFSGWTGACNGIGPCNLTMTQNLAVTAVFIEPGYGLQFVPVTPCRLVDTRNPNGQFGGPPIQGGTSRSFPIPQQTPCDIPSIAAAYSLNVTVVPHSTLGYLTIWPTGEAQPYVSTMNSSDGRIKANAAIVPAGYGGAVSVYVTDTTNVILDIDGYFAPAASDTYQFYTLTPCRVVDTRQGSNQPQGLGPPSLPAQQARDFPILTSPCLQNLPQQPQAYSFNVTVVPNPAGQPLGYLTVWPSNEQQPYVSTLNNPTATVVANAAIVPAAPDGDIDAYAYNSTDLILDINGYFAAPGGTNALSLYPVAPCRVLDTRQNNGQPFSGTLVVNVVGSVCAPSSSAQAYVFNATVVPPGSMPYLTLWPDGTGQPMVSTLNAYDGVITSNMAIVLTTNGSIDAYAYALTQLILDISGYFAP